MIRAQRLRVTSDPLNLATLTAIKLLSSSYLEILNIATSAVRCEALRGGRHITITPSRVCWWRSRPDPVGRRKPFLVRCAVKTSENLMPAGACRSESGEIIPRRLIRDHVVKRSEYADWRAIAFLSRSSSLARERYGGGVQRAMQENTMLPYSAVQRCTALRAAGRVQLAWVFMSAVPQSVPAGRGCTACLYHNSLVIRVSTVQSQFQGPALHCSQKPGHGLVCDCCLRLGKEMSVSVLLKLVVFDCRRGWPALYGCSAQCTMHN